MLTQTEVDSLLQLIKTLLTAGPISFPSPGKHISLHAVSVVGNENFTIDVNRKGGSIKVTKCTYQTRYTNSQILLRLDVDGPDHRNPDGEVIPCPHLHIYREGYGDSIAYPLVGHISTDPHDLAQVLIDFLRYNNINNIPPIHDEGRLV